MELLIPLFGLNIMLGLSFYKGAIKLANLFKKITDFLNEAPKRVFGKMYPNNMGILYDKMRVEMDRRKIYEECWSMYSDDARIAAAIDTTAGSSTNGSFTIQFNKNDSINENIIKDAEKISDDFIMKADIHNKVPGIAKELILLGDVFLEVVIDEDNLEIVDLKKLPARSIVRNEDEYGNLINFHQEDELQQKIVTFEPWQILHMRWNHFSGQRYGTSMLRPIRSTYKKLKLGEQDLVIRRRTRSGLKLHHRGADSSNPLEEYEVEEYISRNNSTPMNVRTDYYSNGKWAIDVLESDDGVSEIDDIKHFEDNLFIGLRTPKGLLGIGEDPNRATLDRQEVAYIRLLNEVCNVMSEQLRSVFSLAFMLKGLDPNNIKYEMVWEEKTIEDVNRKVERVVLLSNGGFISRQTALGEMGYDFEDEQYKINQEKEVYGIQDYTNSNFTKNGEPRLPLRGEEDRIAKGDPRFQPGEGRRGNVNGGK